MQLVKEESFKEEKKHLFNTSKSFFIIQMLWIATFFALIPYISLNSENLLEHPADLLAWVFIIVGIRAFYSGCFRCLKWYNKN
ncbi:hypothetical protein [Pantoea sp. BAV 3049]|uniref:hypothetical protein n=1 Tax=Pantoea sp. BAV 3049 TaxID=2654188 RepID=UPI00131BD5E5|nr:hypothetical protein [Pantoea sp. BAV 3049]